MALAFIKIGRAEEAERLQHEIARMHFPGLGARDLTSLFVYVDRAVVGIGAAIEGVRSCTQQP